MAPWSIAGVPPMCSMARCLRLRHLVGLLARDPVNSPLATGDIVTTGTLTRAFPILPGESWSTKLHGIELGSRPVWFA
jgi:2-oxo-3-hexenedioate decarboxylase